MRMVTRLAGGAAILAAAVFAMPGAALAAPGDDGLGLDVRTAQASYAAGEPVRLTFAVTNASAAACGLTRSSEGAVQISSVRRDGQDLVPVLARGFYLDGIDHAVRAALVSAAPGASVDVALVATRIHDGDEPGSVVLRSVAANPDGSGLDTLWPVAAPGRYEVTALYSVPAVDGSCAGTTAARTVAFTVGAAGDAMPWVWLIGGALLLALAVALIVWLLVRRRHRPAAAVLLLLLGFVALTGTGRPAFADYYVDPNSGVPVPGVDFTKAVAACFKEFEAPGGDPSGLLPRLKDPKTPKVRIVPTVGGSGAFETPASKDGKGSSTITWNPTVGEPFGDGVPQDPCSGLYHELNHSDDISKDTVPPGDCGDTGIKTAEVKATLAENRYRVAKGLMPRTEYKGNPLPKSLDDCKKPKKKTPPTKGPVKLCLGETGSTCGTTNGDPHLATFDHAYYDFQAVGEFDLVKSTAGDPLEVQTRQSPMLDSKTVSVNTAVAFGLGTHKVELTIKSGITLVRVDGAPTELTRGDRALPGGGTLTRRESDTGRPDGYDVTWPDGSAAAVDQISVYGYRLLVKLAPARAGQVSGLLGNFNGDADDDLGGLTRPVAFEKLYPAYADRWRIKESLFTYGAGQSTATFTDRAFPARAVALADLDATRRAQAESICRWSGIDDAAQFNECVFDVGVTGRPEFAVSAAATEQIAPPPAAPIAATPLVTGTLTAGGEPIAFTGRAGQGVFVDVPTSTLKDQCSPYRLLDPAGTELANGCNIAGHGYIDRVDLPADGRYTVALDPTAVGRASVAVYVDVDVAGSLAPNGAPVTATLDQPGAVARYRFTGVAGQRVYLDVTESSLPSQCSPLELRDPDGKTITTGCVISGTGEIDGTVLPADGAYTILVDPKDRTVGASTLRLYAANDKTGDITVGGPPVVVTIAQPGAVTVLRFTGRAGQSVTVTATKGTLPSQCSPLELRYPDGKTITDGCVINGTGDIPATVLPVAGTYTLVVDPSDDKTGAITLTLR
jgi:hypothetical protein